MILAFVPLAGLIICVSCGLVVVDVLLRAFGFRPFVFTIDVVEFGLLYFTMFAAPYLVRVRGHVMIDVVVSRVPAAARNPLEALICAICAVAALVCAWIALELLIEAFATGTRIVRGVETPQWVLFLPIPPGFLLAAIEFIRIIARRERLHQSVDEAGESI